MTEGYVEMLLSAAVSCNGAILLFARIWLIQRFTSILLWYNPSSASNCAKLGSMSPNWI